MSRLLDEAKVEALTAFGLTTLQAKVYIAFVEHGTSTAGTVAKNSGVARQEVYRIIAELSQMGFLEKVIASPMKYEPVSLENSVALLLKEKRKKLIELEMRGEDLLRAVLYDKRNAESHSSEYRFVEMQENDKRFKAVNMFAGLKTYATVNASRRYAQVILSSRDVDVALNTGTNMRVIVDKPKYDSPCFKRILKLMKKPSYKIRFLNQEPDALFSIRDDNEVYLMLNPSSPRGPPYLISNHPTMLVFARQYFETLWCQALELDDCYEKDLRKKRAPRNVEIAGNRKETINRLKELKLRSVLAADLPANCSSGQAKEEPGTNKISESQS